MTREMALFSILVGSTFWLFCAFGKRFVYRFGHRPAPLWYGRLVFGVVGLLFNFVGLAYFIRLLW
jgi:hypothetical protein